MAIQKLLESSQRYHLENPSALEVVVEQALQRNALDYQREALVKVGTRHYLIDFVVSKRIAIEVNGSWVHQGNEAPGSTKPSGMQATG